MMNKQPFFLAILLPIVAFSAVIPFQQTPAALQFGDDALRVSFSPQDGSIQSLERHGQTVAIASDAAPWLNIKGMDGNWLPEKSVWTLQNAVRTADDTLRLDVVNGNWTVRVHTQLISEKAQLRRWFEIAWTGEEPTKIRHFRQHWFEVPMSDGMSYELPANRTAREKVTAADVTDHAVHAAWSGSRVCIFQLASDRSFLFLTDELAAGFDHCNTTFENHDHSVSASLFADIQGHMKPNDYQLLGDYWLWFQDNDADVALTRVHEWQRDRGLVPPADRPDWVRRATLYSFHPNGSIGSNWADWGGFVPSLKQLDRIAELGCNAIWILPLEDASPYCPNDYYKFQPGLGTAEDYKRLVDHAHELGMHVMQDIVPHGGTDTCPRAVAHPEWLVRQEDNSTLNYWCFDFNWPSWIDYMKGVSAHYVNTYGVDGYRVDAIDGSKIANWNPNIPYPRASQGLTPGGLHMMQGIREGARKGNPAAATLAESGANVFGAVSDCLYDFALCYDAMQGIRTRDPRTFGSTLRRWLHEQQCTDLPGQIRLRHIESHDSLRAEYWYGPEGLRRAMAISSWIPGIPMVYQDAEDGHGDIFRRIFAIRNALVEMGDGAADYLAVNAPDDVFAVLRTANQTANPPKAYAWDDGEGPRASIAVVTLPFPSASREISLPVSKLPLALQQLTEAMELMTGQRVPLRRVDDVVVLPVPLNGMAVYRLGGRLEKWRPLEPSPFFRRTLSSEPQLDVEAFAIGDHGECTPLPSFQSFDSSADGAASVRKGLLLRINVPDGAPCHWQASAAGGVWEDRFRTRHPNCDGNISNIYYLRQGGNVLWNSLFWPFGLTAAQARIAFTTPTASLCLQFDPTRLPAAVFLLDRVGDDHAPHLFIAESLDNLPEFGTCPFRFTLQPFNPNEADAPQRNVGAFYSGSSHYIFENDELRLRIARNGTLQQLEGRQSSDAADNWVPLVSNAILYTDAGFGEDRMHYSTNSAAEPFSRITRNADGAIRLQFCGTMRGFNRFETMSAPVDYYMEYRLHEKDGGIGLICGIRNRKSAAGNRNFTGWMLPSDEPSTRVVMLSDGRPLMEGDSAPQRTAETKNFHNILNINEIRLLNNDDSLRLRFADIHWQASVPPANVFLHGSNFFIAWHDDTPPTNDVFGQWRLFSACLTTEDHGGKSPEMPSFATVATVSKRTVLQNFGFEEHTENQWVEKIVQFFSDSLVWSMPNGATVDSTTVHNGKNAIRIDGADGEYRLIRQHLPLSLLPPGSVWRLSCWVKSDGIAAGSIDWMHGTLRFTLVRSGKGAEYQPAANFPNEPFDWRPFSVELTIPEGLESIAVAAGLNGNRGRVWLDDFSLERLDAAKPLNPLEKAAE